MSEETEKPVRQSDPKPPRAKLTFAGIIGAVVLGLAGIAFLFTIKCALSFGQFAALGGSLSAVILTWLLTKDLRNASLRILLRCLAFGFFLWPFIPHKSVEWSSPWPPAGFWLWQGLQSGALGDCAFDLFSILIATAVMWLAALAVHRARNRHRAAWQSIEK